MQKPGNDSLLPKSMFTLLFFMIISLASCQVQIVPLCVTATLPRVHRRFYLFLTCLVQHEQDAMPLTKQRCGLV